MSELFFSLLSASYGLHPVLPEFLCQKELCPNIGQFKDWSRQSVGPLPRQVRCDYWGNFQLGMLLFYAKIEAVIFHLPYPPVTITVKKNQYFSIFWNF